MNNTTNHINNALFTKKNETRFVDAFERLVNHLVKNPTVTTDLEQEMLDALQEPFTKREKDMAREISALERMLKEANAKLSRRF